MSSHLAFFRNHRHCTTQQPNLDATLLRSSEAALFCQFEGDAARECCLLHPSSLTELWADAEEPVAFALHPLPGHSGALIVIAPHCSES